MHRTLTIALVMLAAACASSEPSHENAPQEAAYVYCIYDRFKGATLKTKEPCFGPERQVAKQEFIDLMGADFLPGSATLPPSAAYCFDSEGNDVYLRDSGGCYWDDHTITESEFVAFMDRQVPPASIAEREKRWVYCLDPRLNFVYARELTPCSSGDRTIDRATYIDHIQATH
jgi:hypothetical protein